VYDLIIDYGNNGSLSYVVKVVSFFPKLFLGYLFFGVENCLTVFSLASLKMFRKLFKSVFIDENFLLLYL